MGQKMIIQQNKMTTFVSNDSGAVTVDWVVLTAGLVGLGLAVSAVVSGGVGDLSSDVGSQLSDQEISASFAADPLASWSPLQWDQHNAGIYDSYSDWMSNFTDDQLLAHYENTAQWSTYPPNSGHPYDTYHDEHFIARDEAISRGLISPV